MLPIASRIGWMIGWISGLNCRFGASNSVSRNQQQPIKQIQPIPGTAKTKSGLNLINQCAIIHLIQLKPMPKLVEISLFDVFFDITFKICERIF